MKKSILVIAAVGLSLISFQSLAQKTEVRKEVKMENVNGEKILTIITEDNGNKTEEVYKGEAADQKLAEIQGVEVMNEATEDVKVETINGEKVLTITKNAEGKETVEVLKGQAAEDKLKEMEKDESPKQIKKAPLQKREVNTVKRIENN